ncbi:MULTISPECIES: ANTAR domain-containing response regulator [unclassified Roseivivax]|uniref:ANTAR domain-containing response regulator n=1 Tax=Roseivivax sp. GX 12232 TaxID=2900547 RepID=UPI001E43AADC|nr:ANTAR domain-containing protein [Roseivivax sp. GX 12232]MCE0504699.1 ANTAR domain-containing protein [Roseivivax sp. GX 12232]
MSSVLTIVIVEADPDRAKLIVDALREAGDYDIHIIGERAALQRQIQLHSPDVVLVDEADPSRDTLEELALASGPLDRPVALFVDRTDQALSTAAIEAGLSAYVVDGLTRARVKPVLDAAIARFQMVKRMRTELAETKKALEERKVIDRAKGLVMRARGIDEEEAYALLRRTAMEQNRRIADVAQALVTSARLLG